MLLQNRQVVFGFDLRRRRDTADVFEVGGQAAAAATLCRHIRVAS